MPKQAFTKVYDLDYFTGSQMFLYIGDVWIDEITSLSYSVSQQKTPIYGYASQLYDAVAAGQVIVQGQFTINFKEQGYLWAVLRRYKKISEVSAGIIPNSKTEKINQNKRDRAVERSRAGKQSSRPVNKSNTKNIQRQSIERIIQGNATTQEKNDFYQQLAGYSSFDISSPKDRVFENIVEAFEDQVWVKDNNDLNSQIRRTDDNRFDNFDMYVVFGNYANPKANHTVQKIIGVHLVNQGKLINIDGMPIQEQYSFLARTVA